MLTPNRTCGEILIPAAGWRHAKYCKVESLLIYCKAILRLWETRSINYFLLTIKLLKVSRVC